MSSTARGGQRSPADFYGTPAWTTYHLVSALRRYVGLMNLCSGSNAGPDKSRPLRILEPCAGRGAIVSAAHAMLKFYEPKLEQEWTAVELEQEMDSKIIGFDEMDKAGHSLSGHPRTDFFEYAKGRPVRWHDKDQTVRAWPFDVVIMNPPFRFAIEFIQTCLKLAPVVIALERLNFLGSDDRADFMRMSKPSAFVIPNRVSFHNLPDDVRVGATDSIEYAWLAWGLGSVSTHLDGIVRVLPALPKELRIPRREFELNPTPVQWANYMGGGDYDLAF